MKTIVINENVLKEINEKLEMTEYKFISNIKYFLSKLIADPVNAESTTLLKSNGLNYNPKHYMSDKENTLIKELKKHQIIKEKHKISDRDENGEPKNATFIISYSVPKKDLDRKIKKMYIELFENNVNESVEYLTEARGHPGHDVIRNFYQSQGLKDGKIYDRQKNCVGEDKWVTKKVKDKDGNYFEQEGWQGGDGENTVNLHQLIQGTYTQMVNTFIILQKEGRRFTPGVATMWTRGEFGQMFENPIFNTFNTVLEMIVEFHKNDYDGYLRRIRKEKKQTILIDNDTPTAEELIDRFSQARTENIQATKDKINSKEYENTKYFIRPITEYDDLLRYEKLCYPDNVWCLMNGEVAWKHYTSNGIYQFYLVLDKRLCNENGDPIIENKDVIPAKKGKSHPNDEYGLSMMGIIVDMDGELAYCTSRWNHAGNGDDHTMNAEEISNTLGVNFYHIFKPNHVFQDAVEKALTMYRENGSLSNFTNTNESGIEELIIIQISKKYNILNTQTGELISKKWYNNIEKFHEGFARVYISGKGFNSINSKGELLSNTWFNFIDEFRNGFASIKVKNKGFNFINTNNEILSDIWFDSVFKFRNGLAIVQIENKGFNFIRTDGQLISDIWFDNIIDFTEGLAKVYLENKGYNFINTDGQLISDIWFNYAKSFNNNIALIQVKRKGYNFINHNGEVLSKKWFNILGNFNQGLASINVKNKGWNFVKINGEILSKEWFDNVSEFYDDGVAKVYLDGKGYNFINTDGQLISDIWFEMVWDFVGGYGVVDISRKERYKIDVYGNLYDIDGILKHNGRLSQTSEDEVTNEGINHIISNVVRNYINEEMGGATATSTVGDYEYDVPTFGDEETLKRGNGVGGSTSINYADNRKNKRNKTIYK